jgi:hypothetical protein
MWCTPSTVRTPGIRRLLKSTEVEELLVEVANPEGEAEAVGADVLHGRWMIRAENRRPSSTECPEGEKETRQAL